MPILSQSLQRWPSVVFRFSRLTLLAIVIALPSLLAEYATDDAFIHLRIAHNFAVTGEPSFNLGEGVMATSSPLWTLLTCALAVILPFPLLYGVALTNGVITAAAVYVWDEYLAQANRSAAQPLMRLFHVVWLSGAISLSAVQGMETALALLLLGCGFMAGLGGRVIVGTIFMSLAASTRLELAVIGGLYWLWIPGWLRRFRALGFSMIAVAPVVIFSLNFFGTVVPHTIYAKSVIYDLRWFDSAWLMIMEFVGRPLFYDWPSLTLALGAIFCLVAVVGLLSLSAPCTRSDRLMGILAGGGCAIAGAYLIKGVYVFPWYVPLYTVPIGVASLAMIWGRPASLLRGGIIALAIPGGIQIFSLVVAAFGSAPEFYPDFLQGAKVRHYRVLGEELRSRYPAARVMSAEVGGLGFGFGGYIIDAAGLVTPRALEFHRRGTEGGLVAGIPEAFARALRPEIIVGVESQVTTLRDVDWIGQYRIESRDVLLAEDRNLAGSQTVMGSRQLLTFIRRDVEDAQRPQVREHEVLPQD